MAKIIYNTCYGGFSLSGAAIKRYAELSGKSFREEPDELYKFLPRYFIGDEEVSTHHGFERTDPILVKVVEELGNAASGAHADLAIATLEPGTKYRIDEYDGMESVMTIDDYEWSVA